MLAETVSFWTVDSIATDHVARDRTSIVEFCRILKGSRCIYMGKNAFAVVLKIDIYKLELRKGCTLYLHDVLYAPEVQKNLVSMLVLLELSFHIVFDKGCVKIFLDNVYYDSGYFSDDFMMLDTINVLINDNTSIYVVENFSASNDNESVIWHAR